MRQGSLSELISKHDNPVQMLRNSKMGMLAYPVVPPEFSNWRDEQLAWREGAAFFDQCHHMDELIVDGPDARALLESLSVNSFNNFTTERAKHYVPVSHDGYVIGDVVIFRESEDKFILVGRAPVMNWVKFNAESQEADVKLIHDPRSPSRPDGNEVKRTHFRFQVQGPKAWEILTHLNGGHLEVPKFFHTGKMAIAGVSVNTLRHGMVGMPGVELWGDYADKATVRQGIFDAAAVIGIDLTPAGHRAYTTTGIESGWIPSPVPAIYTSELMKPYRDWLGQDTYEAFGSLGGSFVSDRIEDYYLTPHELGYGGYISFDHDFVGKDALLSMKDKDHRKKVTLEWHPEDVLKILGSYFDGGTPFKWIDFPQPQYAASTFETAMKDGSHVGFLCWSAYTFNERRLLSLGIVDSNIEVGDELTVVWGEPAGSSGKTSAEVHRQTEIRVQVAPVPYSREARENYAEGWRTREAARI